VWIMRWIVRTAEAFILGLMVTTAIGAQDMSGSRSGDSAGLPFSVTNITIGTAILYVGSKLTELIIKIVETWKSAKDKDENGKILRDLVMLTAERDSWKEDYEREQKEKIECRTACEKAQEKADHYREELYQARIQIATLTGSQVVPGGSASSGLLRPPPLSEGK
jgi:hypothetical protein